MLYDLEGVQVSEERWSEIFHSEDRRVARDLITAVDSAGETFPAEISTVWIGISWGMEEKPLIYETMVFAEGSWMDLGCWRWATRAEAHAGHQRLVSEIVSGDRRIEQPEFSDDEIF